MNKFADIALIALLTLLYVAVFCQRSNFVTHAPIKGVVATQAVSVSTSSLIAGAEQENNAVVKEAGTPRLQEFKIYSEYPIPESFIAKSVDVSALADYILLTPQGLQEKLLSADRKNVVAEVVAPAQKDAVEIYASTGANNTTPTTQKRPLAKKPKQHKEKVVEVKPKPSNPVVSVVKDTTPDVLTYPSIEKYVMGDSKSFIYPMLSTGEDIVLSVISMTPYKDSHILRYTIENKSNSYFFIEMTQLSDNAGNPVITQKFGEDYVSPGHTETVYLLLAKTTIKQLDLKLASSGGKAKCLELNFTLP